MFLFLMVLFILLFIILVLYIVIVFNFWRDKMVMYWSDKGVIWVWKWNSNLWRMIIVIILLSLLCWLFYIVIMFMKFFFFGVILKCNFSFEVVDYIFCVLVSFYCVVNFWICFFFVWDFICELGVLCKWKCCYVVNN